MFMSRLITWVYHIAHALETSADAVIIGFRTYTTELSLKYSRDGISMPSWARGRLTDITVNLLQLMHVKTDRHNHFGILVHLIT